MKTKLFAHVSLLGAALLFAACGEQSQPKTTVNNTTANASANTANNAAKPAAEAAHWDYESNGPAKWGTLNKEWSVCSEGKKQSPIDIVPSGTTTLPKLGLDFKPAELRIIHNAHKADGINNGHTIQINYSEGDTLDIGGEKFSLVQYHFHGPSEHTVNGKHFPMEMHLVHQSADKKLAVLGVFIAEGQKANAAFEPIWSNLPQTKGSESHFPDQKIDVDQLLPTKTSTYRYDGSLTTPPCSEGVKWIVFSTPIELSADQIKKFKSIIVKNNRPTQPLNDRTVATDHLAEKAAP